MRLIIQRKNHNKAKRSIEPRQAGILKMSARLIVNYSCIYSYVCRPTIGFSYGIFRERVGTRDIFFKKTDSHRFYVHGSCSSLVNRWTGASSLFFTVERSPLLSGRVFFAFLRRLNTRPTITIMSSSLAFRERWIARAANPASYLRRAFLR